MTANGNGYAKCGKRTKSGKDCTRPAGWGTSHAGVGPCKLHLGNTPSQIKASAKELARVMGSPVDVTPHEALIWCVQTAAGEAHYCTLKIQELAEEDAIGHPESHVDKELQQVYGEEGAELYNHLEQTTKHPIELNIWIRSRREAMDRLARYSKMALDAGVEERRVRMAEQFAQLMVPALQGLLDGLGLTKAQQKKAPALVRSTLVALEGTGWETTTNGDATSEE
jgi:hypothetical protein